MSPRQSPVPEHQCPTLVRWRSTRGCSHAKAAASSTGLAREKHRSPAAAVARLKRARSPRWPGGAAFGARACNRAVVASVPARPAEPASRALATAGCCSGWPGRRGLDAFGLAPGMRVRDTSGGTKTQDCGRVRIIPFGPGLGSPRACSRVRRNANRRDRDHGLSADALLAGWH
jgi:hypothetical protein